jgi:hypothetical protein
LRNAELGLTLRHDIGGLGAGDQNGLGFHLLSNSEPFKDTREIDPAGAALCWVSIDN